MVLHISARLELYTASSVATAFLIYFTITNLFSTLQVHTNKMMCMWSFASGFFQS